MSDATNPQGRESYVSNSIFARSKRWMYQNGRPNWLARLINRGYAIAGVMGVAPDLIVTLEVPGRTSGKVIKFPLVITEVNGERYLVSMLGKDANWVKNLHVNQGNAELVAGKREAVHLEEIPVEERAPILKSYLKRAPGARPHIPVDMNAPLEAFEKVADEYPIFCVVVRF